MLVLIRGTVQIMPDTFRIQIHRMLVLIACYGRNGKSHYDIQIHRMLVLILRAVKAQITAIVFKYIEC